MDKTLFKLSNNNADKCAEELMQKFSEIYGKKILSGQHSNKATASDFEYVKRITGKYPAVAGFDFLSYSSNIDTPESDFNCIDEIINNRGSVEKALELHEKTNCILTFCWHWFAPLNGKDKSFYTENSCFNLEKAFEEGSTENRALIKDLDLIAEQLQIFREKNIPILWRPLHEAEGGWFWWGAHGPEACIKLYRLMYDRFTNYHKLNNLIWIWNSLKKEWYPGDDVVDIVSCDYYAELGDHNALKKEFEAFKELTDNRKLIALSENGPIPDPEKMKEENAMWLWFMTWNNFSGGKVWNTQEELKKFYNDDLIISL